MLSLSGMSTSNPNPANGFQQFLYSIARESTTPSNHHPQRARAQSAPPTSTQATCPDQLGFPTGSGLTYTATQPARGSVTVASDGTYTYTPNQSARQTAGLTTTDTFTATVHEGLSTQPGHRHGSGRSRDTGGGYIQPSEHPTPSLALVTGSAVFTDTAGRTLAYSTPTLSTAGGTVSLDTSTGAYSYTPTQAQRQAATLTTTDAFTVTASNGVDSATETVTVPIDAGTPVAGHPHGGQPRPEHRCGHRDHGVHRSGRADPNLHRSHHQHQRRRGHRQHQHRGLHLHPNAGPRLAAWMTTSLVGDTFSVTASNGVHTATETMTVPVSPVVDEPAIRHPYRSEPPTWPRGR